jgi:hypothetical protein
VGVFETEKIALKPRYRFAAAWAKYLMNLMTLLIQGPTGEQNISIAVGIRADEPRPAQLDQPESFPEPYVPLDVVEETDPDK